jgi:hypothetical protein
MKKIEADALQNYRDSYKNEEFFKEKSLVKFLRLYPSLFVKLLERFKDNWSNSFV